MGAGLPDPCFPPPTPFPSARCPFFPFSNIHIPTMETLVR